MRVWKTDITAIEPGRLTTYGVDQLDVIEQFSFEEMLFLLLQARRAKAHEVDLLRATIVSHISHGITGQSTLAVRMAADCRATFLNALVAGFSTGSGPYHQGGLEATMRELVALSAIPASDLEEHLLIRLKHRDRIMGFGHRFHKLGDPRAQKLIELARGHSFHGEHLQTLGAASKILQREKSLAINIEAAGGAILLDLGFEPAISHLFIVLGRAPMFAAAYQERIRESPTPFPRIKVFDLDPGESSE